MRRGSNGWKSKAEEYEMINNLDGFDNLRAMLEGEATRRKKNRRGNKNKKNKTESQFQAHNPVPVEVQVQAPCKDEAVRMVEVSKTDLIELSEANVPNKVAVDTVLKKNKMIETAQTGLQVDTVHKENKLIETAQTGLQVDIVHKENKMIETAQTGLQVDTVLKVNKIIETAQTGLQVGTVSKENKMIETAQTELQVDIVHKENKLIETAQTGLQVDTVHKENKIIETAQTGLQVGTVNKENKMIETAQPVKSTIEVGNEVVKDAIDLQLDDDLISNVSTNKRALEKVSVEATVDENGETLRRKVFITVVAEETASKVDAGKQKLLAENAKHVETAKSPETRESAQNIVLRKLLRKPRYFDPPNDSWTRCLTRGDDHPTKAKCSSQKKVKPCFICGSLKHVWKSCSAQGQFCFVGRGRGHQANCCPEKQEENSLTCNICLRCGDSGHDMFSCRNEYSPDDLKKIQCYTCNGLGHLICVKMPATSPTDVSCFNCGESGHLGWDCTKCPIVARSSSAHISCYRCREEGHFARTCSRPKKSAKRVRAEMRRSLGSNSAPPNLHRPKNDARRKMQETVIVDGDP